MPRWASRITLEITDIRVERLQDISEWDSVAEGCRPYFDKKNTVMMNKMEMQPFISPQQDYARLWESINGKESWDANPWVWVVCFKVHKRNVDEFLKAVAE